MTKSENAIEGFVFTDLYEYNEAKKEAEAIEYIKANNDLDDYSKLVKLYHKLVEQGSFHTPIGLMFLKQLQEKILSEGMISSSNIACIPVDAGIFQKRSFKTTGVDLDVKEQDMVINYRIRLRNLKIISCFLGLIIIIMMFMAIFTDRSKYADYEKKILNKYAAWEEDLSAREKALQREEDLQTKD